MQKREDDLIDRVLRQTLKTVGILNFLNYEEVKKSMTEYTECKFSGLQSREDVSTKIENDLTPKC